MILNEYPVHFCSQVFKMCNFLRNEDKWIVFPITYKMCKYQSLERGIWREMQGAS